MRSYHLLLIVISIPVLSNAQISLVRPDFPMVNDFTHTIICDSNASEGPAGAGITWIFNTLDTTNNGLPYNYPYTSSNSICVNVDLRRNFNPTPGGGDSYSFQTTSSIYNQAYYSSYYYSTYSLERCFYDNWTWMKFPFTYQDSIIDHFSFNGSYWDGGTQYYYSNGGGYDSTFCDAWGTILLPFGTFNVLRTVSYVEFVDSGYAYSSAKQFYRTRTYNWYANQHKCPVLTIQYRSVYNFTTQLWSPYNKFVLTCPEFHVLTSSENFSPGLDNSIFSIASENNALYTIRYRGDDPLQTDISINDVRGKKLMHSEKIFSNGSATMDVNLRQKEVGIYFISLYSSQTAPVVFKVANFK